MPEMVGLLLQSRTNTTMAATKGDYLFEASFRNSRVPQIMTTKATNLTNERKINNPRTIIF